eukprot:630324-Pyramimonas_sp.AAC.1
MGSWPWADGSALLPQPCLRELQGALPHDPQATALRGALPCHLAYHKRQRRERCLIPAAWPPRDKGANVDIPMSISTFVEMLADPWITLAGWNYEPP